ncbi:MAG: cache domain-containing protein [Pseudodesulfovibrio sp.]
MSTLRDKLLNLPIRFKLFYFYSVAFLVYILVGNFLVYTIVANTIEENIEEQLKNNTAAILNLVRTSADTAIRNYLRAVAEKNYEIVEHYYSLSQHGKLTTAQAKEEAAQTLLSQTIATTGYIYAINSNGIIQVHPKALLLGQDLSGNNFIQQQKKRKQGYIEYDWANPGETDPRPKALYMTYFAPWDWIISASSYRDEFKKLINVSDFRESILNTTFGETGYPYVMDSKGTLIVHPALENTNIYNSTDSSGRKFIKLICEQKNGSITYPWQNPGDPAPRQKLVLFNYIPEFDWIVASSSYLEEFYQPLQTVTYATLGLGAVLLLFLLPLTWVIGTTITRPLNALMDAFQEGTKGDLANRMPTRPSQGKDELGLLANYYNTFMNRLETSQKQLVESEGKYRNIVEHAVEGVFQTSTDGRLLQVNPAMTRLFGYDSPQEFMEQIEDVQEDLYAHASDRQSLLRTLENQGFASGFEVEFKRKDNERFWGVVNARAVYADDGKIISVEGMVHDITEQQKARTALTQAKEQAEAASRLKSDFLSMISHEMRTPLTSIIGYAKLAGKKMPGLLESQESPQGALSTSKNSKSLSQVQDSLAVIADQGDRLSRLIQDLFDLIKLESGEMEFAMEFYDPNVLIENTLPKARVLVEEAGLSFTHEISPLLAHPCGDSARIEQVILSLVENAAKFTSFGHVTLRARQTPHSFQFEIQDTGPGIPPEYQEQLFERFFQIGEVLTGKPHGSGLGLAICQQIVHQHGGHIQLESDPGHGSTFTVDVPLSPSQECLNG